MSVTGEPTPPAAAQARTIAIEATSPQEVDWAAARLWRVLVTLDGVPVSSLWVPAPGRLRDPDRFTRSLLVRGLLASEYWDAYARFRERMGLPERTHEQPRVSVVVCTHRRSTYLPALLAAVRALDPQPYEFIVVDNAPGELDSRAVIEAAGARYVREDRKGLDHARTAGVRAATGDLIAFTDDDCIPDVRWLARLGENFDDPSVAAVTGPAFAYELETPAQVRFELEGGFGRGLHRRVYDWTELTPPDAGVAGAGANMTFRREVLESIGDPFPSELDAGTPTESGGDMYVLYKVLAAGHRIVYDPGTFVLHRHRRDPAALHKAFWGYGVGLSAVMAKLLVENRELDAIRTWGWLWRQYRSMLLRRLAGSADARSLRVSWDYLRGGFSGGSAWTRAKREIPPAPLANGAAGPVPAPGGAPAAVAADAPEVSVIVPTVDRPEALRRCLDAVRAQAADVPLEILVIDDSRDGSVLAPEDGGVTRVLRTGGNGAAAARNTGAAAARGRLLLFLDDDLIPAPGLVERHRARHEREGEGAIVIGYSPPAPKDPGLCESAAALWWHEHFELLADTTDLTFADMLSGNMSIARDAFSALGGFDATMGRMRREDWLFGYQALQQGARLYYERDAVAAHEFSLPTLRRFHAAREEGHGDAIMLRRHPELGPVLDEQYARDGRRRRAATLVLSLAVPALFEPTTALLDALEAANLRRWWLNVKNAVQRAAYAAGRREGGRPIGSGLRGRQARTRVRPGDRDRLPPPGAFAMPFEVEVAGRPPKTVVPALGRWNRTVAHDVAAAELSAVTPLSTLDGRRPSAGNRPVLLIGPAHTDQVRRAAPPEAVRVEGAPSRHWAALGAAVAGVQAEYVAFTMPDVAPSPAWLERVADGLDGDRVAVVLGHDPGERGEMGAPYLVSRTETIARYATLDEPFHYVVVHRERFLELGGFAGGLDALGPYAPPLDLAERALDAGLVVMFQRTGGLRVPPKPWLAWRRREWQRQRARGALLARHGAVATARGAVPLVLDGVRHRVPPRVAAGRLTAFVSGATRPSHRTLG